LRQYEGARAKVITFLAVATVLYHVAYVLDIAPYLGVTWYEMPARAGSIMFILVLTFLLYPARKGATQDRLPWYDVLLILGTILGLGYTFFFAMPFMIQWGHGFVHAPQLILGLMVLIAVFEAARRIVGWPLIIIVLVVMFHSLFAEHFPSFLVCKGASISELVGFLYMGDSGLFGVVMGVFASIIIMFLLFAQFLLATGAGEFFIKLALAVAGRFRGGPAKVAILASGLLGTMMGSPSGNVASTGVFTIPLMKRIGYEPKFAGGVEAVASTGAAMAPPVMAGSAFIMCEFLNMSYAELIIYAAIPAILYYLALFIMVDIEAVKTGIRGLSPEEVPPLRKTLRDGWIYLFVLFALLYFLVVARYLPQVCALYSVGILIAISMFRKKTRMSLDKVRVAIEGTVRGALMVGVTCALAGVLMGSLGKSGLGVNLAGGLVDISGGNIYALLGLTAFTCFIMSMGMPSIPLYIVLALLVAPALVKSGVLPISAHLFIYYWGHITFITPPLAVAAYVAAGIAGSSVWNTAWSATRLGIIAFIVPIFIVFSPALILIGSVEDIALAVTTAIVGTFPLACSMSGFALRRLNWLERVLLLAGGIMLLMPSWIGDVVGVALAAPVLLFQLGAIRRFRLAEELRTAVDKHGQ
jgi:TRAP transporter 4TM/12TM fusion protein